MKFIRKKDYKFSLQMYVCSLKDAYRDTRQIIGINANARDGFNIQLRDNRGIYWLSSDITGTHFIKIRFFINRIKNSWKWYYKDIFIYE